MAMVRVPVGARDFSQLHCVQTGYGAHTASYPIGTGVSFPGVMRPGREAVHSRPYSAEVKNDAATPVHLHKYSWRSA
jgi:hypothetical protein